MNKNSVSEFDKAENQKVQPEAVQKRNREFTDKLLILKNRQMMKI